MNSLNLGCSKFCPEFDLCIDLNPHDPRVWKADVYDFLSGYSNNIGHINAKNILEHMPDVGKFFELAYEALRVGGTLTFETDNATWLPFYIPYMHWFFPRRTWIGAAVNPAFTEIMNGSPHLYVFTLYHLRNFAVRYDFKIITLKRTKHGAHLYGCWKK